MSAAAANPLDPLAIARREQLGLRKFLIYSLILHGLLVLSIVLSIYLKFPGEEWGGIGGQEGTPVKITSVGPMPGIPLPPKPNVSDSKTADPSNDLFTEQPPPNPVPVPDRQPEKPAEKIAPFKKEKPLPPTKRSKVDKPRVPPPDNAVTGHGAPPNLPTSYATQPPGSGTGPVSVQGQGGGDFASKYAWYVEGVRRRISQNWIQASIDPAVRQARVAHAVMTFTINRDGSVRNVQLTQSSGNLSYDNSARRALDGIQFAPLPNDFAGSHVDVTFDFDLSLTR
jgi:periplasmic protein TonB